MSLSNGQKFARCAHGARVIARHIPTGVEHEFRCIVARDSGRYFVKIGGFGNRWRKSLEIEMRFLFIQSMPV